MKQLLSSLMLLSIGFFSYRSFSQEIIEIHPSTDFELIGEKIEFLKDSDNRLQFDDVLKSKSFLKSDMAYTNYPATNATYWVKFSLINYTNEDILIRIGCGWIAEIDVYSEKKDGSYNIIETGYLRPFINKDYPSNNTIIKLADRNDSSLRTYYIRFHTSGYGLDAPMYVGTTKQMMLSQQENDWLMAVYVGAVIIMICYNLIVYISVKVRSYFYYLIYLISLLLIIPYVHGSYAEFWLYRQFGYLNFYFFSFSPLFPLFSLLFLRSFLKIDWSSSKSYRFAVVILVIILSFGSINLIAGLTGNLHWWLGAFSSSLLVLACLYNFVFLILVFKAYREGQKEVRYIAIGWSAFFIGVWLMVGAQQFQLFPIGISKTVLIVGSFIEIALFSTALSERINKLQKERNKAKADALSQALENKKIIQKQNEFLERKVQERTLELNVLNENLAEQKDRLEEAVREKDGLMGIVAHDLKNPLNGIIGFTDLALSEAKLSDNMKVYLDHISKLSDNGKNLIEDLLTISISQNELKPEDLTEVHLTRYFHEILIPFKIVAAKKSISFSFEMDNSLPEYFYTEIISLRRIIENLVSNAIKFSKISGNVNVMVSSSNHSIIVKIKDSGPGFTEGDRKKMFKKFQTLSARPTAKESSTGLGLSIVKALCTRIKASISVESTPGNGATFILIFPDLSISYAIDQKAQSA